MDSVTIFYCLKTDAGWDIAKITQNDCGSIVDYSRSYKEKRNRKIAAVVGIWRLEIWEILVAHHRKVSCDSAGHLTWDAHIINPKTNSNWPDSDFCWEGRRMTPHS